MTKRVILLITLCACAALVFLALSGRSSDESQISLDLPAVICDDYGGYIDDTVLHIHGTWDGQEQKFTGTVSADCAPYSARDKVMEQEFSVLEESDGIIYASCTIYETPVAYKGNYLFTASTDFSKFAVYFNGYGFEGLVFAPAETIEDVNGIMENWIFTFG